MPGTLKVLFAAMLVVSLGIKLLAASQSPIIDMDMGLDEDETSIVPFMVRQGYTVTGVEHESSALFATAMSPSCEKFILILVAQQGYHRDLVWRTTEIGDEVFFVFNGRIYEEQPVWLTRAQNYWFLINNYIGRAVADRPVFAVIGPSGCHLKSLPWQELSVLE